MQGGLAPAGVLADFLEVEPRYERVVEDFLRDELNYVVVKSWDAADEGLRLLRTDVDGRATFLVHPEDSQAKFSFVARRSHALRAAQRHSPAAEEHDSRAQRIRQIAGSDPAEAGRRLHRPRSGVARELALENPDAFFLSQSGECFHNVTVTGGKQRSRRPAFDEARTARRAAPARRSGTRPARRRNARAHPGREIKDLTSLLDRLEDEKREAEKQAMTSGHMLQQLDSEMSRVARAPQRLANANCSGWPPNAPSRKTIVIARKRRSPLVEEQRAQLEQQLAAGQESPRHPAPAPRRSRRKPRSQHAARVATLEERHRSAAALLQRIESLVAEMGERATRCNRKWNPPPPKNCSANPKTSNWRSTPPISKPNAMPESPRRPAATRIRATPRPARRNRRTPAHHPPAARPRSRPPRRTVRHRRQAAIRRCSTWPKPA